MNFFKRTKPNKAINSYEDLLDQELYPEQARKSHGPTLLKVH